MKALQIIIFSIAVVLFVFCWYTIWEFYQQIFNPNDPLIYLGIYLGIAINFIASIILLAINLFMGKHKDKIFYSLYLSTNMFLIIDGIFLIIARLFL